MEVTKAVAGCSSKKMSVQKKVSLRGITGFVLEKVDWSIRISTRVDYPLMPHLSFRPTGNLFCHFDRPEGAEKSARRTLQIPRLRFYQPFLSASPTQNVHITLIYQIHHVRSKCSHKFMKAEKDMRRNAQRSFTQKSKFGINRALAVHYIIQDSI